MKAIAHEVLDPRDVLQSVETDLLENGSADVRPRVLHDPVGLQGLPILRGAAYLAALNGEPWRPRV
jgi:hypothetical protein